MAKLAVVGSRGMLGSEIASVLGAKHEVVHLNRPEFDVADPSFVAQLASGAFGKLHAVLNCAAYTAVDKAESDPDEAAAVNALGAGYVAAACRMAGARLFHFSTDFVFDGRSNRPYVESDAPNPIGVYGRTKLEGEEAARASGADAVIVRTAWLYGPRGHCFPKAIVRAWRAGKPLRVVADQIGNPTCTLDLALSVAAMLEDNAYPGVYHLAGPDAMTWHEFALLAIETFKEAFDVRGVVSVEPIRTEQWPTAAKRPAYSVLDSSKALAAGAQQMRPARESLSQFWKICRQESLFEAG